MQYIRHVSPNSTIITILQRLYHYLLAIRYTCNAFYIKIGSRVHPLSYETCFTWPVANGMLLVSLVTCFTWPAANGMLLVWLVTCFTWSVANGMLPVSLVFHVAGREWYVTCSLVSNNCMHDLTRFITDILLKTRNKVLLYIAIFFFFLY